jgi:hypothetical protein
MRLRTVLVTGLCLVVPAGLIIGIRDAVGPGTSTTIVQPTVSASATGTPATRVTMAPLPSALPRVASVWDLSRNSVGNAQDGAEVAAALRAEVWRSYAIAHGEGSLLTRLQDPDSYLGPYAAAIAAAQRGVTTPVTPESFGTALVGQVSGAEQAQMAEGGVQDGDTLAIILQITGGVLGPGATDQGTAVGTQVVFVGRMVDDPELGAILVVSYIGACPAESGGLSVAACIN